MKSRIVISFDFELGWGVLEDNRWRQRESSGIYGRLRQVMAELTGQLSSYEVPVTWGLVSSMLVDRESDLVVDHLPRSYRDKVIEFYRSADWKTRCALDVVENLLCHSVAHEICSHSSTHIYAQHTDVTRDAYLHDIFMSIDQLNKFFGYAVSSIIFPRDQDDFRRDIARENPMNFRLNPRFVPSENPRSRLQRLMTRVGGTVAASVTATGEFGEVYQTGSLFFNWPAGRYERLRRARLESQIRKLLRCLARGSGTYHVWLHPFNLARTPEHHARFQVFLDDIVKLRDEGRVDILTMSQLVQDCLCSRGARPSTGTYGAE